MTTTATTTKPSKRRERSKRSLDRLDQIRELSQEIREHEKGIKAAAAKRRRLAILCWEDNVTYAEMAAAMDSTEQNVYKVIREHIASAREPEPAPEQ